MMDRLEELRREINETLNQQTDLKERGFGFIHLYGVSATCVLLAKIRGLDPQLCAAAGMLHDITVYQTGDPHDHALHSSVGAVRILARVGGFSGAETRDICEAIKTHSDKGAVHGPLAELLKDADVLQHHLYNPQFRVDWKKRLHGVMAEIGAVEE